MSAPPIDIAGSGGVMLGLRVVCDGFLSDYPVRAQSHVHDDHMRDFNRSKGFQNIYMLPATRKLLESEFNADLPYRDNLFDVPSGETSEVPEGKLTLVKNGHMLGSAQVVVELDSGTRLGYSGDFQWPMEDPIEVDALVLDSTYGSPNSTREYEQGEVEARLIDLVQTRLAEGPVHILSHRGTVQRALQVLNGNVDCPVLGSKRFIGDAVVYRNFGYAICDVVDSKSPEGRAARKSGRYIQVYSKGDGDPVDVGEASSIVLSAFMSSPKDPCMVYSDRSYRLAMSNHADFAGTLAYVEATGAKYVVTDNVRGPHGVELAMEIKARLGIEARPSSHDSSPAWGQ